MAAEGCFKDKTSYNFYMIKHPILTHIPGKPVVPTDFNFLPG
jgi:hypothetical protein